MLVHSDLLSLFTPTIQNDDYFLEHTGYEAFVGDCDDYFFAARNRLIDAGIQPYMYVGGFGGEKHIMACVLNVHRGILCLDPNHRNLLPLKRAEKIYSDGKLFELKQTLVD